MSPISHGRDGMVRAAAQSLPTGVDLIFVSYDGAAIYDLLVANLATAQPP